MNLFRNSLTLACPPLIAVAGLTALNLGVAAFAQQPGPSEADVIAGKPADSGHVDVSQPMSNDPFHTPDNDAFFMVDGGAGKGNPASKLRAGSFETVKDGYRRVHRTESVTLSPTEIAERIADGKIGYLVGNQRVMETFTDHLPADWMQGVENLAPGARVDSFGNPIVNIADGLPDWAQRDVDALRQEIANWLLHLRNLEMAMAGRAGEIAMIPPRARAATYQRDAANLEADHAESQYVLGNFVGQAFARGIGIGDVLPFNSGRMTDAVVGSTAEYLHFYEALKAREASRRGEAHESSRYPREVATLLASHGHTMADVLAVPANDDEGGVAGVGGCYNNANLPLGWTGTVGGIGIWNGAVGTYDDQSADIPIGFRYYFSICDNANYNNAMRISTNGYVTFHQQGGLADGTVYSNASLPSPADPNGIAAPWWDDLEVANQGVTDEVVYKVEGGVGFRTFIVEWFSVSRHSGQTGEFYYFQARFAENYPQVEFHYGGSFPDGANDSRTVGLENFSGTSADCGPSCSNNISADAANNLRFQYPTAPNDGCLSPICLEEDEPVFGSNFGSGGTDLTTCVSLDNADVWYTYTAPITATVTVTLCNGGNGYDTSLSVFDVCNGTQLACDDDGCITPKSTLNFNATAGVTYRIRVSGYQNSRGTFVVSVNIGAQGDSCFNPLPISIPGTGVNFYSTFDNTGCGDESPCSSGDTIDEWLTWTAPTSGVARASTCAGSTDFDTTLAIYGGVCGSLSPIVCNDDLPGDCGSLLRSRVLWVADAGTTYLIRVAGHNGARGEYDINLNYYVCPADVSPADTGDGIVNVDDLLAVINAWGPCSGCRADFLPPGGNNNVNVDELLAVINAWNGCQ